MTQAGIDARPSVVIAGGGVAALEAALTLRSLMADRLALTLVSPASDFRYRPLGVGEPFGLGRPHRHDLRGLADDLDATLVREPLAAVDPASRTAIVASGRRLSYDRLLVAVGAPSRPPFEHGLVFDSPGHAAEFDAALADLQAGLASSVAFVVPAEVSWPLPAYELALMTAAWSAAIGRTVRVVLVTAERGPLDLFGAAAADAVVSELAEAGVELLAGSPPHVESDILVRVGAQLVRAERVIALPELVGPRVQGLPADEAGFIPVDAAGEVVGAPGVFAVGDAAAHPIKQGGLAAQQAAVAVGAIASELDPRCRACPYRPVLRGLLRTARGPLYLRASLDDVEGTSTASREPLWWPPAKLSAPRLNLHLAEARQQRSRGLVLPSGGITRAGDGPRAAGSVVLRRQSAGAHG